MNLDKFVDEKEVDQDIYGSQNVVAEGNFLPSDNQNIVVDNASTTAQDGQEKQSKKENQCGQNCQCDEQKSQQCQNLEESKVGQNGQEAVARPEDKIGFWNGILASFTAIPQRMKEIFYLNPQRKFKDFGELEKRKKVKKVVDWLLNNALYILMVVFVIAVQIVNPRFLSWNNIQTMMSLASTLLIVALGIGGIIVLTGTDLSSGRIMGLSAIICASFLQSETAVGKMFEFSPVNMLIPLLIASVVAGLIGVFNGYFVAKFHIHPFIVTLGTQLILNGIILLYLNLNGNNLQPIGQLDPTYSELVNGSFFGLKNLVWFAILMTVIMWFVWNKTKFGRNMFAVGCNPEAATVSGVSVFKTIVTVFMLAGIFYAVAGFFESARVGSNSSSTGIGFELDAIAACVIGGVSFMGGVGKIRGILIGVILLQLINSALVFLRIEPYYTQIIKGAIILIACAIDMRKYMSKK
ncbi:MAG: beta-methylgalactoside transporter [Clostridia bacterium]